MWLSHCLHNACDNASVPQGPGAVRVPGVVSGEAEGGEDAARAVEGAAAAGGRPRRLRGVAHVVPAGRVGGALRQRKESSQLALLIQRLHIQGRAKKFLHV